MRQIALIALIMLTSCTLSWDQAVKGRFLADKPAPKTAPLTAAIQTQVLPPLGKTAPSQSTAQTPAAQTSATEKSATSPEEAACRAQGGTWARAGRLNALTCYRPTKDAGKSCSRQSDCTTQCLAKSHSCAPVWPIFGCSDVLQGDGARVRLCID